MYTWKLCLNVKQNLKIIKMYARVLVCVCVYIDGYRVSLFYYNFEENNRLQSEHRVLQQTLAKLLAVLINDDVIKEWRYIS